MRTNLATPSAPVSNNRGPGDRCQVAASVQALIL